MMTCQVLHYRARNGPIIHGGDDSFKNKTNSNAKEKNMSNFFFLTLNFIGNELITG